MMTFKEQLQYRTKLQHRLAVWEAIHEWLDESFVPKDGRAGSDKAIRVPDCLEEVVPEDCIEEILQQIADGPVSELRRILYEVENQSIIILEKDDGQAERT